MDVVSVDLPEIDWNLSDGQRRDLILQQVISLKEKWGVRTPHEWLDCTRLKHYATLWDKLRMYGNILVFYEEGNSEGRAVIPESMVLLVLNSLHNWKTGVEKLLDKVLVLFFGLGGPRT